MSLKQWKRIEPTHVTKVGWRTITSKTFVMPNGESTVFDLLHPDGQEFAGVIGLTSNNKTVVIRQFCAGPEKEMDELPGGFVDPGETPEQAARREFTEETGYIPGRMEYLGTFHKDKYMNSTWHTFIAYDCEKKVKQQLEPEEDGEVHEISISTLIENAKNDRLTDHAAILMAYDALMKI